MGRGKVSDRIAGIQSLSLAFVIEGISQDLESEEGDASYGVGKVLDPHDAGKRSHGTREFMAEFAAALVTKPLGL